MSAFVGRPLVHVRSGATGAHRVRRVWAPGVVVVALVAAVLGFTAQPASALTSVTTTVRSSLNKATTTDDLVYTATLATPTAGDASATGTVTFARTSGPTNADFATACTNVTVSNGKATCAITSTWSGTGTAAVTATYTPTGVFSSAGAASMNQAIDTNGNTWSLANAINVSANCNSGTAASYALTAAATTTSGTLSVLAAGGGGGGSGSGAVGGAGGKGGSATLTGFTIDGATYPYVHYTVGCAGNGGNRYNSNTANGGAAAAGFGSGGAGGKGGGGNGAGAGGGGGGTGVCLAAADTPATCDTANTVKPLLVAGGGGGGGPSVSSVGTAGVTGGGGNAGSASSGAATGEGWYGSATILGNGFGGGANAGIRTGGGGGGTGNAGTTGTAAANNTGGLAGLSGGGAGATAGSGSTSAYGAGGTGAINSCAACSGGGGGGGGYYGGGGGGSSATGALSGSGGGGSSWGNGNVGGTLAVNGLLGGNGGTGAAVNGAPGAAVAGSVNLSLAGVGVKLTSPVAQNTAPGASVNLTPAWAAADPNGTTTSKVASATDLPTGLSVNATTGAITGSPTTVGTFNTTFTITYVNSVDGSFSRSETFTWTITNNAPTGANQSGLTATKGVGLPITLANADADSDPRTCSVVAGPTKGAVVLSGGSPSTNCTATFTAAANTNGADSFTYKVDDGHVDSATYTVSLTVSNAAPTGSNQSGLTATKGAGLPITLANADTDGDSRTCSIVASPLKGGVVLSGGAPSTNCTATYTANTNTSGADSFTYKVNDGFTDSSTATVSLTISNAAPSANAQSVSTTAGVETPITLTASDANGDSLAYSVAVGPTKGSVTCNAAGSCQYTADINQSGDDTFTFVANDSSVSSAPATVTIHITAANVAPVADAQAVTVPRVVASPIQLTGSDVDDDDLTFSVVDEPTKGSVDCDLAGLCSYTSDVGETGDDSFTFVANDGLASSAPATVTVHIANAAPVGDDQSVGTDVDQSAIITLTASDPDGDGVTIHPVLGASAGGHGSVSGAGASVQYTPDTGFQGVDTFTFTVTDAVGATSAPATVTVYVGVSSLTGTVTSAVGGAPLSGIEVRLVDNANPANPDPALLATAVTNAGGTYDFGPQFPSFAAVPHGDYVIRFVDPSNDHLSEWYVDSANRAGATDVAATSAAPEITADAALVPAGRLQGAVRSSVGGHPPIEGLQVRLVKIGTLGSKSTTTGADGHYAFELLSDGDYQLWFRDVSSGQWISEWSDEQPTQATATTITMTVGQQRVVDEDLDPVPPPPPPTVGTISGTVRGASAGTPALAGIQVRLYGDPYTTSTATTTDGDGHYSFPDRPAGHYKLWFRVVAGNAYVSEYYADAADLASASVITLGGSTITADAQLTPVPPPPPPNTAAISGTVTRLGTTTPIAGIQVRLYVAGVATGSIATVTDGNGHYTFAGRAPGSYQVWFRSLDAAYVSEWNLDRSTQGTADPLVATNGSTVTVDASLAPHA